MKLGYVCTNYNNSAFTRAAVYSLLKNDGHQFRIVVVDNNSDNGNVEELKGLAKEFQEVKLILNKINVGYFKGLNMGIRHLRINESDISFMVIGNNDLVFPAGFADSIRKSLRIFEKYPVVSPDIVTLEGIHQNPHVISKIGKVREFIYDLYYFNYYLAIAIRQAAKLSRGISDRPDENHHDLPRKIYQGYGACYVLGPVFFCHFQELWAPTFILHEEYFLSKQLSEKGLSVYYEPSIIVQHRCHSAMGRFVGRMAWDLGRGAHRIYRQHVKIFT
jgi:GT2 family glycosyltransferase